MMTGSGAAIGPGLGQGVGHMDGTHIMGVSGQGQGREKRYVPKEGKESAIREGTWARKVGRLLCVHCILSILFFSSMSPFNIPSQHLK